MKRFKIKLFNLLSSLLICLILINSLATSSVLASTSKYLTINSKKITGEINKFSYFPKSNWKAGPKIDEYFTTVDTTKIPNPSETYYTVEFNGTSIELFGYKAPNHTILDVSIDDGEISKVDTYSASRTSTHVSLIKFDNLEPGNHILKVSASGKSNPNAKAGGVMEVFEAVVGYPPELATDIKFHEEEISILQGIEMPLSYSTIPNESIVPDVKILSSDNEVIQITNEGLMKAVKPGKAIVTLVSELCNIEKSITVTVKPGLNTMHASIVETGLQYQQNKYVDISKLDNTSEALWSWKADKAVSEIALITKDVPLKNVKIEASDFSDGVNIIPCDNVKLSFIKEVKGFIGHAGWYAQNPSGIMPTGPKDSFPEVIYTTNPIDINAKTVQPIWVEIEVPTDAKAGIYNGTITISSDTNDEVINLNYEIEVLDAVLSNPEDYNFDVEYWQYPYSIAEYYEVEAFSEEHIEILREHMKAYKDLGGHAITASIVEEAWGGQTYSNNKVKYPSMIKWIKESNGNWRFDYSDFDKWVELNKELGIADKIICYSMIPWNNEISYYDENTQTQKKMTANPNNISNYSKVWSPFLEDFVKHLDEKGWFDSTYIGYDERSNMDSSFDIVDMFKNKDGKTLKKSAAFNSFATNKPVFNRLDYASVGLQEIRGNFEGYREEVEKRKLTGQETTMYTATEHFPNSFTKSMPIESYWTIMYAGALNTDGYLRWAFDAWVEDPLRDSTHSSFQAGDCFLIYPDEKDSENKIPKLSVRLAKLDEGVRDINKLYLMREEFHELSEDIEKLLSTVKDNYAFQTVETPPSWAVAGRPAKWATEESKKLMVEDMRDIKEGIKEISKKYINLKNLEADSKCDFNKNGKIDIGDLGIISKNINSDNLIYDVNGDALVDLKDVQYVADKILNKLVY